MVIHYLNGQVEILPFPLEQKFYLYDFFGFSSDDLFAVGSIVPSDFGDTSLVLHYDGRSWHREDVGVGKGGQLFTVSGDPAGNVYIAGDLGEVSVGIKREE